MYYFLLVIAIQIVNVKIINVCMQYMQSKLNFRKKDTIKYILLGTIYQLYLHI